MKHIHHIIPRHAGGTDDPSNLIELTIEEHAQAHKELFEKHGRWQDRIAWQTLSGQISNAEAIKQAQREANLGNTTWLGRNHKEESKAKISKWMKENKNWISHNMPHTEQTKKLISEKMKGHPKTNFGGYTLSDEFREKKRIYTTENNPAKLPEARKKLSAKALIKHPCPHCGKTMNAGNLSRHVKICEKL